MSVTGSPALSQFFLLSSLAHLPLSSLSPSLSLSFDRNMVQGTPVSSLLLLLLLWVAACSCQDAAVVAPLPIVSSDFPIDPKEFVNRIVSREKREREREERYVWPIFS
jgi:hypothetical protein